MSDFLRKKVIRSFINLIFIFPITVLLYLFFSNFEDYINLTILFKKLFLTIFLGLFLISVGYLIRYLRWRLILFNLGFCPPLKKESKIWLASYSFTATPGKIGELIRCLFLKEIFNIPIKYSFFSIILERFFDLISVIIFALCYFAIQNKVIDPKLENILLLILICITIFILIILIKLIEHKKYHKNFLNIRIKFFGKVFDFRKLNHLKKIFKLNMLFKFIFFSLLSWSLEGLAFFLLLKKLNFNISLFKSIFIHTTAGLVGALSMIPGGIGPTEAITIYILKLQSVPIEYGIPLTSIIRLMTLWYITFLGIISFFLIRKEVFKNA